MKPAIFNTDMVRAILDGRKTQTRRSIKRDLTANMDVDKNDKDYLYVEATDGEWYHLLTFAPYKVGDIIYVRETFGVVYSSNEYDDDPRVYYKASPDPYDMHHDVKKWKPSIHMPKEYARLFLRVKDVRIERLNEISADDACKEGLDWKDYWCDNGQSINDPREWFKTLWESIYGKDSFDNRYVWVIEFEQISKEEAYE